MLAAQSVLVAFQLFAANVRKIDQFLSKRAAEANKVRKLPSRRTTKSLATWRPGQAGTNGRTGVSTDPDLYRLTEPLASHHRCFGAPGVPLLGARRGKGLFDTALDGSQSAQFRVNFLALRYGNPFKPSFVDCETASFVDTPWWARGDLNPHILSDTGT